jgi:hypothetical protein
LALSSTFDRKHRDKGAAVIVARLDAAWSESDAVQEETNAP